MPVAGAESRVGRVGVRLRRVGADRGDPGGLEGRDEVRVLFPGLLDRVFGGGRRWAGNGGAGRAASVKLCSSSPPPLTLVVDAGRVTRAQSGRVADCGVARCPSSTSRWTRHLAVDEVVRRMADGLPVQGDALGRRTVMGSVRYAADWSVLVESAPLNWSVTAYW